MADETRRCVPRYLDDEKQENKMTAPIHGIDAGLNAEEILRKANHTPTQQDQIEEMLRERGDRYGEYKTHALITQGLLKVIEGNKNYQYLPDHIKETLHMICHKLGRIINGDPRYLDSWIDIIGYVQLTIDILKSEKIEVDREFYSVKS